MPLTQTDCFIEAIDALQSTLDKYAHIAPVKILGDLNVKLPHSTDNAKWYAKSGYSQHSRIMYDFISSNELICLDLKHHQTTKYTYFCIKSWTYTWIDHVLSTSYDT